MNIVTFSSPSYGNSSTIFLFSHSQRHHSQAFHTASGTAHWWDMSRSRQRFHSNLSVQLQYQLELPSSLISVFNNSNKYHMLLASAVTVIIWFRALLLIIAPFQISAPFECVFVNKWNTKLIHFFLLTLIFFNNGNLVRFWLGSSTYPVVGNYPRLHQLEMAIWMPFVGWNNQVFLFLIDQLLSILFYWVILLDPSRIDIKTQKPRS